MKKTKKMIYAEYGIEFDGEKIFSPEFGWIRPLLINGNDKLGKGVYVWSTLPGTGEYTIDIGGKTYTEKGTCPCDCKGCYAKAGFHAMYSTKAANLRKTYLARNYPDFVKRAIIAQIKADKVKLSRIHESGDFFSMAYIQLWLDIVKECPECAFWSYTKNAMAEKAFDGIDNCNIVKSLIKGFGFNFGKCAYVLKVFKALKAAGKNVYICRCGIDKNQHCVDCKGCSQNEFVLFIEHSTDYKAELDPLFEELKAVIEAQ